MSKQEDTVTNMVKKAMEATNDDKKKRSVRNILITSMSSFILLGMLGGLGALIWIGVEAIGIESSIAYWSSSTIAMKMLMVSIGLMVFGVLMILFIIFIVDIQNFFNKLVDRNQKRSNR